MKTGIYNVFGTRFYIDKSNGSLFIQKENDFNEINKDKMYEILDYYKGMNLMYQPLPVIIYRSFKNGKLNKYKNWIENK